MTLAWIMLAGAVGAPTRYLLDAAIRRRTGGLFPLGTLVINLTGSFALGLLTGLVLYHAFPAVPKAALGTGLCGAFTTFSSFTFESVRLAEEGDRRDALRYLGLSLLVGPLAAALGLAVAAM